MLPYEGRVEFAYTMLRKAAKPSVVALGLEGQESEWTRRRSKVSAPERYLDRRYRCFQLFQHFSSDCSFSNRKILGLVEDYNTCMQLSETERAYASRWSPFTQLGPDDVEYHVCTTYYNKPHLGRPVPAAVLMSILLDSCTRQQTTEKKENIQLQSEPTLRSVSCVS